MSAKDFHAVYGFLVLFFPGVVFVFFSTFVQQGRPPAITKDTVGGMIAVALLYLFFIWAGGVISTVEVLNPLLLFARENSLCQFASRFVPSFAFVDFCSLSMAGRFKILTIVVLIPSVLGAAWGRAIRNKWHLGLARFLGFDLADIGSAWDVAFERLPRGGYVVVTLKDGAAVSGYFENRSAISNDPTFRDIFIGETRVSDEQSSDVIRGTWIAPDQIRTIELVTWRENLQSETE
jgi:hypothetical protein